MDNSNSIKIISLALVFLLVGTGSAFALGVSTPYWDDHPLKMYPGQVKEISFLLVNKVGNPTANAFVSLDESAGVAEITSGSEYSVPAEARDVNVVLEISIPASASIGNNYDIKFSVKSVAEEGQGGNIQLGVGYIVNFPINVVSEAEATATTTTTPVNDTSTSEGTSGAGTLISWIIAVIIIIAIIFWLAKRKRQV